MLIAIIPAFNEERFIGSVVLRARQFADAVIVIDDGSTDSTDSIAEAAGALVIKHKTNMGKGTALNTGFQKARELGASELVILDGDGQHSAADIPRMVQPILNHEADIVLGSRFLGNKNRAPFYRKVGQVFMTWITNLSSGVRTTDTLSGYRAFSRHAVDSVVFQEGGWGVETELQFQAQEHHLQVKEIPIDALYKDKAKRNPVTFGLKILNAILRMIGQHRPLLFFGVSGVVVLLGGLLSGAWVVEVYRSTTTLALGTALISIMLVIIGSVMLFTGIILHSVRGLFLEIKAALEK
jgi:glycosyltransferase involved in cell wall biosynthesis